MKNNVENATPDTRTAWYQVPTIWLAIVLSAIVIAGCIHIVYVGRQQPLQSTAKQATKKGEISHLLGVPLNSSTPNNSTPNTTETPATADTPSQQQP